jgi:hypothetical protein
MDQASNAALEVPQQINRNATYFHSMSGVVGQAIAGPVFVGIGVFIGLIGLGVIQPSQANAPLWVIGVVGLIFMLAGLAFGLRGLLGLPSVLRQRRRRREHPDQPWMFDHDWDPQGQSDHPLHKAAKSLATAAFLIVFLLPFNHWMLTDRALLLIVVVNVFNLIALAAVGYGLYLLLRGLKYGRSRVTFERFPCFLGDTCTFHFQPGKGIGSFTSMRFTLRCIEQVTVSTGSGKNRSTQTHSYELWKDEFLVDEPGELRGEQPLPAIVRSYFQEQHVRYAAER